MQPAQKPACHLQPPVQGPSMSSVLMAQEPACWGQTYRRLAPVTSNQPRKPPPPPCDSGPNGQDRSYLTLALLLPCFSLRPSRDSRSWGSLFSLAHCSFPTLSLHLGAHKMPEALLFSTIDLFPLFCQTKGGLWLLSYRSFWINSFFLLSLGSLDLTPQLVISSFLPLYQHLQKVSTVIQIPWLHFHRNVNGANQRRSIDFGSKMQCMLGQAYLYESRITCLEDSFHSP